MHEVTPAAYIIGESKEDASGMAAALAHLGASDWKTDAKDGEKLIEFYGRLCYKSYKPGLNPNVTKVREGWGPYIKNVMHSKHGSVLEHSTVNVVFLDVSRVFTHELVRHRAGTAFSQESLRFVRLDDIGFWIPPSIKNMSDESDRDEIISLMEDSVSNAEEDMYSFAKLSGLNSAENFSEKKKLTSIQRRLAPEGMATNIGLSANHRSWRHIFEMRCDPSAEEEIRFVMGGLLGQFQKRWPCLYEDIHLLGNDLTTEYRKV